MSVRRATAILAVTLLGVLSPACTSEDGSGGESSFCDTVERLVELRNSSVGVSGTSNESPAETQAEIDATNRQLHEDADEANRLLVRLESTAPRDIAADVQVVSSAGRAFVARLRESGFDLFELAMEGPEVAGGPEVSDAGDRLAAWTDANCGVAFSGIPGNEAGGADVVPERPRPTPPTPPPPPRPPRPRPSRP